MTQRNRNGLVLYPTVKFYVSTPQRENQADGKRKVEQEKHFWDDGVRLSKN
jgi:hypothetical protein